MPIYEYVCVQCGERFERLILSQEARERIACPYCASQEVERAISAFATIGFCAPTPKGFG
ncbi:MAG: zinc ribbon domain-containing protein [Dehalococcoidia bacterium]|nr:zinc ribbon domain-containing protein [Dehalococcoidia bacterium]